MGKKSTQPKHHQNKEKIHRSLIKILRPKVYITDSSSFKTLVQQLTGNGNGSPVSSPPPSHVSASSPPLGLPLVAHHDIQEDDHGYQDINSLDLSFDSSCLEGSPDSFDYVMENSLDLASQKIDLASEYDMDLEALLIGLDSNNSYKCDTHDNYGMIQHEVLRYDLYGLSGLI